MYMAHNYQFLAFSAAMEGRRAEAIEAARQSRALVSDDMLLTMPGADWAVAELYAAMVRFGMWDEILAEPGPNPKLVGLTGAYLYAKATALAAKGHRRNQGAARRTGETGRHRPQCRPHPARGCARSCSPRCQSPHCPDRGQSRRGDRHPARGGGERGPARVGRTGRLVLSRPAYLGCGADQGWPGSRCGSSVSG
jgi:hypothetical protein